MSKDWFKGYVAKYGIVRACSKIMWASEEVLQVTDRYTNPSQGRDSQTSERTARVDLEHLREYIRERTGIPLEEIRSALNEIMGYPHWGAIAFGFQERVTSGLDTLEGAVEDYEESSEQPEPSPAEG